MTDSYYILRDGVKTGPFTYDELIEMGLDANTRVVAANGNTWEAASDMPDFYDYFEARGHNFPTEDNLATFWWRFAAYLIDNILVLILLAIVIPDLFITIYKNELADNITDDALMARLKLNGISFIVTTIYHSLFEASKWRGSIGKKICRLTVVDAEGMGLNIGRAVLRNLSKFLSAMVLCIGYLNILWDNHRQGWHDQIARTYVIQKEA
ncbi:RDD family protein [Mucilaginibacter glaciei]|uniref:RDD family protein n=1 Tax=Mucilaginibacter glaciei TaxID=2772109 RepID=A0A926S5G4_9SPHI|nr:RDD family protein [Mucilaginibacter glaciei]MBD1392726.1 RDD family protein [Mucilaginibacter glaciei]